MLQGFQSGVGKVLASKDAIALIFSLLPLDNIPKITILKVRPIGLN